MSGIFLTVWNNSQKDDCKVLKTTSGGYPHITLVYTGNEVEKAELVKVAADALSEFTFNEITITRAYVNSFALQNGKMRHDVLLDIEEKDTIESGRDHFVRERFVIWKSFFMNPPHVTHAIFDDEKAAVRASELLNEHYLPIKVVITGITVD